MAWHPGEGREAWRFGAEGTRHRNARDFFDFESVTLYHRQYPPGQRRIPVSLNGARPLIVGLGGTPRQGSSSEIALRLALAAAEAAGATTSLVCGRDLALPIYDPTVTERSERTRHLVSLLAKSDGIIISSPGYHGSISGLVKNALDYAEDLRGDLRTYLEGRAVGCIICANGWQATGTTLVALRSIVHALRGWPTPLGVTVNSAITKFSTDGTCDDAGVTQQLGILGRQVVGFALRDLRTGRFSPGVLKPASDDPPI
jgi:FMN reductase